MEQSDDSLKGAAFAPGNLNCSPPFPRKLYAADIASFDLRLLHLFIFILIRFLVKGQESYTYANKLLRLKSSPGYIQI